MAVVFLLWLLPAAAGQAATCRYWLTLVRLRYSLGAGDQVRIIIFGEDNLTGEFRVNDSGNIALPLVGSVHAAGLTSGGLETAVGAALRRANLVRNPSVAVEVIAYRPIYVLGEVNKPGQYPYQPGMTVVTAVAVAGGFTYRAVEGYASVVRTADGKAVEGRASRQILCPAGRRHHGVRAAVLRRHRRWASAGRSGALHCCRPRYAGAGAAAHHRPGGCGLHRRRGAVAGGGAGLSDHPSGAQFVLGRARRPSPASRHWARRRMRRGWAISTSRTSRVPRGGPLPGGHVSHQLGLDADVGLDVTPKHALTAAEREAVELPSMVRADQRGVEPAHWSPQVVTLLHLAAGLPGVDRILVNAAIKKQLCDTVQGDRSWLRMIRPWYDHSAHMHIHFRCPAGSARLRRHPAAAGGRQLRCDAAMVVRSVERAADSPPRRIIRRRCRRRARR